MGNNDLLRMQFGVALSSFSHLATKLVDEHSACCSCSPYLGFARIQIVRSARNNFEVYRRECVYCNAMVKLFDGSGIEHPIICAPANANDQGGRAVHASVT